MERELFPFQQEFVDARLKDYEAGITWAGLFADTGTGKTPTSIRLVDGIAQKVGADTGESPTCWIVTDASVKWNWAEEIGHWTTRPLSPLDLIVVEGDREERLRQLLLAQALHPKWVILNYDQMRLHLPQLLKAVRPNLDLVVLDEADRIQSMDSRRSIACRAIAAHYRIALTATPIPNRIDTLYPVLQWLQPGERRVLNDEWEGEVVAVPHLVGSPTWGSFNAFLNQYAIVNQYNRVVGVRNVPLLHRRLREDFHCEVWLKRDKLEGMPPTEFETELLELTPAQAGVYQMMKEGFIEWVEGEASDRWFSSRYSPTARQQIKLALLAQLTYMRMATSMSPYHLMSHIRASRAKGDGPAFRIRENEVEVTSRDNAKLEWLASAARADLERSSKGGVLVFSQWTNVLDEAEHALADLDCYGLRRIDGSVANKDRFEIQQEVQSGQARLVLTSTAGGRGMNLQRLNQLYVNDLTWTPSQIMQALGRIERIGQSEDMFCTYLIARDTIDAKKMVPLLKDKQKDADAVLQGERGRRSAGVLDIGDMSDALNWV